MKRSVLFDMNSETCFLLLVVIVWKCEYFFIYLFIYFFLPNVLLLYALGFHACILWPLGWLWLKSNLVYIWFFWSFSLQLFTIWFRLKRAGQLNGWVSLVHLEWYRKWKWNSSTTLSKIQIIDKVNVT